jgi:hypothetical protein
MSKKLGLGRRIASDTVRSVRSVSGQPSKEPRDRHFGCQGAVIGLSGHGDRPAVSCRSASDPIPDRPELPEFVPKRSLTKDSERNFF